MPVTLDDYEVICTIGTGSYGTCKKIRRKKDGKVYVWKEMEYGTMGDSEKQMLVSEVNLLRELRHENIVRYYDRIIDRANTTLYIIMEYCEGGDLATLISKMKREGRHAEEEFIWKICSQTAQALQTCHNRNRGGKTVLHRDLKPANVFLTTDNNVKLGDFGLARVLHHETSFAQTFVGTPYYMSPEQMNYQSYNEKSDIWSLGCLLYELCTFKPPFQASSQRELTSKICVGRFARIPYRYSDQLNHFISCMLRVDEHKRPSIKDVLEHPHMFKYITSQHTSSTRAGGVTSRQGSLDEGYESKVDSLHKQEVALKEKEETLQELERRLQLKEQELLAREESIIARESLADDKLKRAERLLEEAKNSRHKSTLSDINIPSVGAPSTDDLSRTLTSCLSTRDKRDPETPKKKVSFHENKENAPYRSKHLDTLFRNKSAENAANRNTTDINVNVNAAYRNYKDPTEKVIGLQQRLQEAKKRSEELRTATFDSKLAAGDNVYTSKIKTSDTIYDSKYKVGTLTSNSKLKPGEIAYSRLETGFGLR